MLWHEPVIQTQTRNVKIIRSIVGDHRQIVDQGHSSIEKIRVWSGGPRVEQDRSDLTKLASHVYRNVENGYFLDQVLNLLSSAKRSTGPQGPRKKLAERDRRDGEPAAILCEA